VRLTASNCPFRAARRPHGHDDERHAVPTGANGEAPRPEEADALLRVGAIDNTQTDTGTSGQQLVRLMECFHQSAVWAVPRPRRILV
jgi:hypothetical protein